MIQAPVHRRLIFRSSFGIQGFKHRDKGSSHFGIVRLQIRLFCELLRFLESLFDVLFDRLYILLRNRFGLLRSRFRQLGFQRNLSFRGGIGLLLRMLRFFVRIGGERVVHRFAQGCVELIQQIVVLCLLVFRQIHCNGLKVRNDLLIHFLDILQALDLQDQVSGFLGFDGGDPGFRHIFVRILRLRLFFFIISKEFHDS